MWLNIRVAGSNVNQWVECSDERQAVACARGRSRSKEHRGPHAQETADLMVAGGVQAILNYAPVILKVPDSVTVREIDPVSALQSMTYYIHEG